jgi:hypothetical protein
MKNNGRQTGGADWAKPIVVTKYWVYVHSGIAELPKENDDDPQVYEYDELQYSVEEYTQIIAEQNVDIQMALVELAEVIANG